jgi:hypothetical protein
LKVAVTAAVVATEHGPVPVQAPLQPAKTEPEAGVAVRRTVVLEENEPLHVGPQSMLTGDETTVPAPVPALLTLTMYFVAATLKLALTLRAALMVTEQGPVPEQTSLQPVNVEPDAAVAVRTTTVEDV